MKTNIKQIKELHYKAEALLELANEMQHKIDDMLRYNVEIAAPNGFRKHSEDKIDTCQRGKTRLLESYKRVLTQIIEL
jgi:hypothetical protein